MPGSSIHSTTQTLGNFARKIASLGHPDIKIVLDNHSDTKIYSTLDALSGRVEITSPFNARFDEIRITLEGTAKTYIESISPANSNARTTAVHNFLRMIMPVRDSDYPTPRIAEAGRTYRFPFNFVIPQQLLPRACQHDCRADHVHQAHLQLPPTMGDKELVGQDDLSPEMSKIQYSIKVRVMKHDEVENEKVVLTDASKRIHVVPAQAEAPPMSLGPKDDYCLSKTKTLRKGVFSGRLGKLTVSSTQTGALMLPPPAEASTTPATTMATINLRFDPRDGSSLPPKLGGLTTKIKVLTFFSVRPHEDLVLQRGPHIDFDVFRAAYETSVHINSRCVENVTWKKETAVLRRKNSASSSSSSDNSDCGQQESDGRGFFYTASIIVPISLPANKKWVPTFHSCISSRVYRLDLALGVHSLGANIPSTSITLHLPVQIGATGSGAKPATLTPAEAAAELAEVEEYLRPRVIEMPNEAMVGRSILPGTTELPPSYEATPRQIVAPGRS